MLRTRRSLFLLARTLAIVLLRDYDSMIIIAIVINKPKRNRMILKGAVQELVNVIYLQVQVFNVS